MKNYQAFDETERAHKISSSDIRIPEIIEDGISFYDRCPLPETIISKNRVGKNNLKARGVNRIHFGLENIDLKDIEQIIEISQTKALCYGLAYSKKYMNDKTSLREVVKQVIKDINQDGLDVICNNINGNFSFFREFELAFVLNRLNGFDLKQKINK